MAKKHPITVAYGDGIGPEIMEATLHILQEGGAELDIETIEIGEKVYLAGEAAGIDEKAWKSIRRTKVFLKAPITTPQGGGYRSVNVTIRAAMGLYANVRPCISYAPFVETKHPVMDLVVVRENEEDLYTGIEYQLTPDVCEATKLISRPACEKIIRFAFEYAQHYGRKKVTSFTKDNILKMTDGLFHKVFDEIGEEYPKIEREHWIVDIGAAKFAHTPENFDVVVLPNLYGDILSDVGAQLSGSVGLGGSANIGEKGAMFEAIHGSAPRYAGKNIANPSALLLGAIQMLLYIQQPEAANRIHNAWLKTIEDGIHTKDIYKEGVSQKKVGTREFAAAVVDRLGKRPEKLKAVDYTHLPKHEVPAHTGSHPISVKRELVGVDIYLYSHDSAQKIQEQLVQLETPSLQLQSITNRGVRVWPEGNPDTICIDQWRCRFRGSSMVSPQVIGSLIHRLADAKMDVIKSVNLYTFDGKPGFSDA